MLLIIATAYSFFVDKKIIEEIPVSMLAQDVINGKVKQIKVEGEKLNIDYNVAESEELIKKKSKKENEASLSETLVNYGVTPEQLSVVNIEITGPTGVGYWLINLAPFLIPVLFLIFFFWFISRQVKGSGGMQAFSFGQSKARIIDPDDKNQRVVFKDVAGNKEAKEELYEIVDFLKNPKKFLDIGARIPKGLMLVGAPGTGKTLMARAVAGEASVPFFIISGSEFVEMFVGVGASRVRDLFKIAKKAAPAIIFIDEIDAVGRVRGTGVGGGNDEREQTLNQILVEMDGFEPNEKVIIIAATNRPDVLDPALLRPGRFDRRVMLNLPDIHDREAILDINIQKKPLAEDVVLRVIAERTPGFSGADLASLMNEAAILAARENRKKISQFDLVRSIEKVMLGPVRKSHLLTKKEKEITAYHEAGHALIASVLPYADPVHKVTIISRGTAGGYTLSLPIYEKHLQTKKDFLDDLAVFLGGFVVEKMIFDDITTGPSNDLQVATAIARSMVTSYGMSDIIGPVALESPTGRVQFGRGVNENEYSETMSAHIDKEVSRLMNEALERAKQVITKHKEVLHKIAKELIQNETLERKEFEKILITCGITPKKPEEDDIIKQVAKEVVVENETKKIYKK
ncbi:ATP-dependent zinc metalloprotease FtsH [Patescibacteria group bacterium]|nr:ATP-dependent zinc metalloprotease FtsH [Patescibacteria group bacterium]MBU2460784.1 ATP-dependent zinc metalloprotease FtsH [Patescibacteria group bacterium]